MGSFKEDLIWWKEERRAWFYQHVNKANAHRTVCQLTPKRTNWPSLTTIRPWDVIKKTFKWLERERNIRDSTHDDSLSLWFYCYCYVIFFLLLNGRNGWMIEWYNRRKYLRSLRDLVIFTLYIFVVNRWMINRWNDPKKIFSFQKIFFFEQSQKKNERRDRVLLG